MGGGEVVPYIRYETTVVKKTKVGAGNAFLMKWAGAPFP